MYRSIISVFLCKPNLSLIFLRWLSTVWRDPDELFEKVEEHDGKIECEPYYNKWALYVAMNKAASDQNSVILKWIGDDKDKYIIACYDLALTDLKDKDRPYWIRKYFHVESKF